MGHHRCIFVAVIVCLSAGCIEMLAYFDPPGIPSTDPDNQPLPPGAVRRLGTLRMRHLGQVRDLAFSPDNSLLFVALYAADFAAKSELAFSVWETATGKLVRTFSNQQVNAYNSVQVSSNGQLLLTSEPEGPCIRSLQTNKILHRLLVPNQKDTGFQARFSPDGLTVACSSHHEIQLWDSQTGRFLRRWRRPEGYLIGFHAFFPDGKTLLTTEAYGNKVLLWDIASGKIRLEFKAGRSAMVAFAPDGKTFAISGSKGEVQIRDVTTTKLLHDWKACEDQKGSQPYPLTFSPDGKLLAAGTDPGLVKLWDPTSGKLVRQIDSKDRGIITIAFSSDGKQLATGGFTGAVRLWQVSTGKELLPFPGHCDRICSLQYLRDGTLLSTCLYSVRLWDVSAGREIAVFDKYWALVSSPDGKKIAFKNEDGSIGLKDLVSGKAPRKLIGDDASPIEMCFSPSGDILASFDSNQTIRLWQTSTGWQLWEQKNPQPKQTLSALTFSPDGRYLASGGGNGDIRLWDVATGKCIRQPDMLEEEVRQLAFSPDGNVLAAIYRNGPIGLWDVARKRKLPSLCPKSTDDFPPLVYFTGGAFSPDGHLLATQEDGVEVGTIRLWEIATGQEVSRFRGRALRGEGLAFSPNGRMLASGCDDNTILVWDILSQAPGANKPGYRIGPRKAQELWRSLASPEGQVAQRAVGESVHAAVDMVPLLSTHLNPVPSVPVERLKRWVKDLDSEEFAVREEASKGLLDAGEQASSLLRQTMESQPSVEVKVRIEGILKEYFQRELSPEGLRQQRALAILEMVGTPPCSEILNRLASGASGARLTREACRILDRQRGR